MDSNPAYRADCSICDGCPATYALKDYSDEATRKDSYRSEIQRQEAITAEKALNEAASEIGCRDKDKRLPVNIGEVPVGKFNLILLVTQCPSSPEYIHRRQPGMSIRTAKVIFGLIGIIG